MASIAEPHSPRRLSTATMLDMSVANFGTAIAFALQQGSMARIFQSLGADLDALPILMIAGPITGLVVQPLIGHYSDRTWCRLGRRRPYIAVGAVLAAGAMAGLATATTLAMAVVCYWLLDAALNVAIEPLRAFIADRAPAGQRTAALAINSALGCVGAIIGFLLPFVLATGAVPHAAIGSIAPGVRQSLLIAALVLLAGTGWTTWRVREYPRADADSRPETAEPAPSGALPRGWPWLAAAVILGGVLLVTDADPQLAVGVAALAGFGLLRILRRRDSLPSPLTAFVDDLSAMPRSLRGLAVIHALTWFALYIMWPMMTAIVTSRGFGADGPRAPGYEAGADWLGVLYAAFNVTASLFGFLGLPALARSLGKARAHALCLAIGAMGYAGLLVTTDRWLMFGPFVCLGIAWASLLTLPYVMLADALGGRKLGAYTGIFNIFVVLPQIAVATLLGPLIRHCFPHDPVWTMALAAAAMGTAALLALLLRPDRAVTGAALR
ncbi:MAG: MFS transporter [Sphingomonadales bacterium]|nr:MFS transporter [Sphingomonadales bacterium]